MIGIGRPNAGDRDSLFGSLLAVISDSIAVKDTFIKHVWQKMWKQKRDEKQRRRIET